MAERTGIAWCDSTFNPWIGCAKVSEGCKHCYAETQNIHYRWVNGWGPQGERRRTSKSTWDKVARWEKERWKECDQCGWRGDVDKIGDDCPECGLTRYAMYRTRRRVFVGSLMDVFEDHPALVEWREQLLDLVEVLTKLDFLLLTKRVENVNRMIPQRWLERDGVGFPSNLWMGVTIENQEQVGRLAELAEIPTRVRFVSVEPMLEKVVLPFIYKPSWVICGGESGAMCRRMEIEWAVDLKRQCEKAGVPFFMKQLGGHPDKRHYLGDFPAELQAREFPKC